MTITLRKRKIIETKLALTKAFIQKLYSVRFSAISIKEICEEVGVSEATFYNYFPQKIDVICYFTLTQHLEMLWILFYREKHLAPLKKIELLFELFEKKITHPYLFFEVVGVLFEWKQNIPQIEQLDVLEKKILFPHYEAIDTITIIPLREVFRELIQQAQKANVFSNKFSAQDLSYIFHSILIGVPLSLNSQNFNKLTNIYKFHLHTLQESLQCPK
ncbi:MAG: TetR/AcrR family transcriptional regulator [Parachlamydiales bacterium]|nr:TetR/AcrR family transcriptional regulator [Parachlamydiales bacterium]